MRVSDYGGHHQDRHHGSTGKPSTSFYCCDCKRLFYLTKTQDARAKTAPKCPHCGGPGNETIASAQRRTESHQERRTDYKPYYCEQCRKSFRSEVAFILHLEENHAA